MLTIRTNYHWRPFVYGYELSESERTEFDYIGKDSFDPDSGELIRSDDLDSHGFIRYHGQIVDPSEFMRTPQDEIARQELNSLSSWHGYQSDSYFSGLVIRYSDDCEEYQIGTYCS